MRLLLCQFFTSSNNFITKLHMNVKPLHNQHVRDYLNFQRGLLVLVFFLLTAFGAQAQTVTTDKDDYSPGQYVIVTGTGWTPGETVSFDFHETPQVCTSDHHVRNTIANADGSILYSQFLINEKHLGVSFVLTATGQSSGLTAVTNFTDAGIRNVTVAGTSFCAGQNIKVNFEAISAGAGGAFKKGNIFTAQISNTSGSFTAPINIGMLESDVSNVFHDIEATIPANATPGAAYIIRVISSDPIVNSGTILNTASFSISAKPEDANAGPDHLNITGTSTTLAGNAPSVGTGAWSIVSGTGGSFGTTATSTSSNPAATFNGTAGSTYVLRWTITNGACTSTDDVTITFNSIIATTTTLSTSVNPSVYAQAVTFTATVAPNSGSSTPTGNVVFKNGSDIIGTVALSSVSGAQRATFTTSTLAVTISGHYVTAVYQGADSFEMSSSNVVSQVVNKATATVTLAGLTGQVYNGSAMHTTATTDPAGLTVEFTYSGSATEPTEAGSYTVVGTINNANYSGSATGTLVIGKATSVTTVTIAKGAFSYTGSAITPATVSVTGAGGLNLAPAAAYANNVNAGTATASYTFAGDDNHIGSSDSKTFAIGKAPATLALGNLTHTYDGTLKSATATTTPAGLTGVSVSGSGTDFGSYEASASLDNANYTAIAVSGTLRISKAPSAVSMDDISATYNGSAHAASATATGVGGLSTTAGITYSYVGTGETTYPASAAAPTNAGTYSVTATYAGGANHTGSSATATVTINPAPATISVADLAKTYNGSAQGATVITSPAGLAVNFTYEGSATVPTAAGTYAVVAALNNGNYTAANGTGTLVIAKAPTTTVVTIVGGPFTYTGSAITPATVRVTGAGGLELTPSAVYAKNVNSGTATASYSYAESANYLASTDSKTFNIGKANATIAVSGKTVTYDGNAHGATGTATGVNNEDLSSLLNFGASFTNVPGGTASWTFAGNNNYNIANGTAVIVINKADQVISWTAPAKIVYGTALSAMQLNASLTTGDGALTYSPAADAFLDAGDNQTLSVTAAATTNYNAKTATVSINVDKANAVINVAGKNVIYDGNAHGATGTATGARNEDLNSLLNFGSSFTNVPGGTASWSFAGDANHNVANGTAAIVINKATATLALGNLSYVYDSNEKSATATTTPANLTGVSISNNGKTNAGTYAVTASLSNTNYEAVPVTANLVIEKTNAIIAVEGKTVTYDGAAHGATGSAKGVKGETLAGLDLGASFTNVPGGTANWTFTDATGNYNNANGSVAIAIDKATTTTVVTIVGGPFTYTGSAITPATVTVTGAGGLNLTPAAAYANNVNAGTGTASYTFAGDDNHIGSSDSKTFAIGKAPATLALGNLTHTYDGTLKSATATTTPAGLTGVTVSGSGTDFGTYAASASLDNANYEATAVSGTINISKASSVVSMENVTATYNGNAHAAFATATGAGGLNTTEDITYSYVGTGETTFPASAIAPTNAGTYSVTATYAGGANHTGSSATATVTINPAPAMLALSNLKYMFDGSAKSATVTTSPAGIDVNVTYAPIVGGVTGTASATAPTAAGTYAVVAALNNSNYSATNATGTLYIYNAPTVTLRASDPVAVNNSSTVTAIFGGDVLNKIWSVVSPNGAVATYAATDDSYTITSTTVGVYTVTLSYTNGVGIPFSEKAFSVFFDPTAGFVTGGGWIDSPAGASTAYPDAVGRANFGFVSKYEKGANKPTGNTEFQFKAGDLNFKSTNYQWLTVSGARAQFKGTGTINGVGSFDFILTAIDGQVSGGGGTDKFRIKITNTDGTIVYDNQRGLADDAAIVTEVTGSIVIHQPANVKAGSTTSKVVAQDKPQPEVSATKFLNYPNPYNDRTTIAFTAEKEGSFALEVYDVKGALVRKLDMGVTEAGKTYEYDLDSRNMPEGMYFARLMTSSGVQTIKMVLKR